MKEPKGTIIYSEDRWLGFVGDDRFESAGIGEICDMVASALPYKDIQWETLPTKNGLSATRDGSSKKISKSDQV